jgi:peroxiredoxin
LANTEVNFGHSYQHKLLKQQVANQKQQAELGQNQPEVNNKYNIGMAAPDIKLKNPEGKEMSLYALKGKVVLVDFWASWCGPCRRENPNVIKAYDKYNKDGFEVFSVSLDRSVEPWKRAIEQDGLKWPYHVSDLKGWKSEAAALYEIHSIPHTLLINRDGTIAGTHLRGPQLESKLAELFGK